MADMTTYSSIERRQGTKVFHTIGSLTHAMLHDDSIVVIAPIASRGPKQPSPEGEEEGQLTVDYNVMDTMDLQGLTRLADDGKKREPKDEFERMAEAGGTELYGMIREGRRMGVPTFLRIWNVQSLANYISRFGSDHFSIYLPPIDEMIKLYEEEGVDKASLSAVAWSNLSSFVLDSLPEGKRAYLSEILGGTSLLDKQLDEKDSPHFKRAIDLHKANLERVINSMHGGTPCVRGLVDGMCTVLFREAHTTKGQVSMRLPYDRAVESARVTAELEQGRQPITAKLPWLVWGYEGDWYHVNPYAHALVRGRSGTEVFELASRIHGEMSLMGIPKYRGLGREIAEVLSGYCDRKELLSLLKDEQVAAKKSKEEDGAF
jgi:hypothetical protein